MNQKISGYFVVAALAGLAAINIDPTDLPNAPSDVPLSSHNIGGFLTGEHIGNLIRNAIVYSGGHQLSKIKNIIPADSKSLNVKSMILQNKVVRDSQLPQKFHPQEQRTTDCLHVPLRIENRKALVPRLDPPPSMSNQDDDNQKPRYRRGQLLDIYV
jgi:hypothetical protein